MSLRNCLQQSSRKGISDVFVYLILLLITAFSGFIVYYMAGNLINDYILRTLGVRLTLHGLALYYNTLYSMPSGVTSFDASYPSQCYVDCIDCSYTIFPFNPVPQVYCDCGNGELEQDPYDNILNSGIDETRLRCDDYIINGIEPVMLFVGQTPVASAVRFELQVHPESSLIFSFSDLISQLGVDLPFYEREITVFTEMPVNLNDFSAVRRLITNAPISDFDSLVDWDFDEISLSKQSFDNYESLIGVVGFHQGLRDVLQLVFNHSSNQTIIDLNDDGVIDDSDSFFYCDVTTDDDGNPDKGLLCPMKALDGEYSYRFSIKPGLKIVQEGSLLCEYECYEQSSIDSSCSSNRWNKVFCFDFSDVVSVVCDSCSADDVDYSLSFCDGECVGSTSLDYSEFTYVDVLTGVTAFEGDRDEIVLTIDSGSDWGSDCSLSLSCADDSFSINVGTSSFNACSDNDLIVGDAICDLGNFFRVEQFTDCDSEGSYAFVYGPDQQFITISDTPSQTVFESILSPELEVVQDYRVTPIGSCGDPDFRVILEPVGDSIVSSKMVSAPLSAFNDRFFDLTITNVDSNPYQLNIEVSPV